MRSRSRQRALNWPRCLNVRDLGGLPTADGGQTLQGALIRSDNLDRLTPDGITAFHAAGVRRVVDVRTNWECARFPSPFAGDPLWRNSPLTEPSAPDYSDLSLTDQYTMLLDRNPRRLAAAIAEIADAPPGAVVVHCHAGKDRTGVVVGLVLSLLQVPPVAIAADYAIVGDSTGDMTTLIGAAETDSAPELAAPDAKTMMDMLAHLDDSYGGAGRYLAHGGLTARQVDDLRRRLICPRADGAHIVPVVTILHFCSRSAWTAAQRAGEYRADTLSKQGFIHCSTAEQVHLPAHALMRGRADIVLLEIDPDRVPAAVRWEPGETMDPQSMRFPHVYGPIPIDAVVGVHDFPPNPDGTFTVPTHLLRGRR